MIIFWDDYKCFPMKGEVDYFISFLVGGLVLLIIMVFFVSFVEPEGGERNATAVPSGREFFTPYRFAFDISKLPEIKTFDIGERSISDGFLFGSEELKYSIKSDDAVALRISFNVSGSNFYLPLIVKVNGDEVARKPLFDGEHQFIVRNVTAENLIEISTESSSWRLWAPSLYKLKGIRFDLGRFSEVSREFRFNVTDARKVARGVIDFTFSENEGIITIRLNNNTVYRDAINDFRSVELSKNYFITGINRLTMTSDENSRFRGTAVMAVTYESA